DDFVDATGLALMTLFKEIRSQVSDDPTFYNWGRGKLPHERELPKLYHDNGSYDQVSVGEGVREELATYNPDGSPYTEDWSCVLVGDVVVVSENGKEISRHPRWMQPLLLAKHTDEYQKKWTDPIPKK